MLPGEGSERRAVRSRRKSRGSSQARPLRPNEPIVFGYPRDRFTSHPSIASLRDESRRAESSIYGSRAFFDWTAEMEWTRSRTHKARLSLDASTAGGRRDSGARSRPPFLRPVCCAQAVAYPVLRASGADEPSRALSAIHRPATAPDGADMVGTLSIVALPPVIDKNLVIDWDVDKVPKSRSESQGLQERSHLAKCKIVQQYQTKQQAAARALKDQSMQKSPTAASRAAASLPPAEVKHQQHPLNGHWSQERAARIDRLSMPTAVRLRQVTYRREKPQTHTTAPATAFSAHTAVAAAKMYASGHKGWQSRKTPWVRSDVQKRQSGPQRRLQEQRQQEGDGKSSASGYPAAWEPRVESLAAQFEGHFSKAEVIEALLHLDGHAGKTARLLRGGISDAAFQAESPAAVAVGDHGHGDSADGEANKGAAKAMAEV